ncbi:MAG: hypothetical protein WDO73_15465 [Ignavibacteriota bacterium]
MKMWWCRLLGVALVASAQPRDVNFYSVGKEVAVGGEQARDLAVKTVPLNDPVASAYVDGVIQELAPQILDSKFSYTVGMVKDGLGSEPKVLMGGYLFVRRRRSGTRRMRASLWASWPRRWPA